MESKVILSYKDMTWYNFPVNIVFGKITERLNSSTAALFATY